MDAKQCEHMKTAIGIDREFLRSKKNENKVFECLGKFFFLRGLFISNVK